MNKDFKFSYADGMSGWFSPLNLRVEGGAQNVSYLNILIPTLLLEKMSGGPNTILVLAMLLAKSGTKIRIITTNTAIDTNLKKLEEHLCSLINVKKIPKTIQLVDGHDRSIPINIGENDIFMATAWWTAQMAKYAIQLTTHKTFLYLIQDWEILLHAGSTDYALALETYSLDFIPIVNTRVLLKHFADSKTGKFADPDFCKKAIAFEPAIDVNLFYPVVKEKRKKKRLIFYARPITGHRNLYELGLASLKKLVLSEQINISKWEFYSIGNEASVEVLGDGITLKKKKWESLQNYAKTLRESDVLLSLMLSPHPSYPPLEMAGCNNFVVTNIFGSKNHKALASYSPYIKSPEANIESICRELTNVMKKIEIGASERSGGIKLAKSWKLSFEKVLPKIINQIDSMA
jgi:hypothetical protein